MSFPKLTILLPCLLPQHRPADLQADAPCSLNPKQHVRVSSSASGTLPSWAWPSGVEAYARVCTLLAHVAYPVCPSIRAGSQANRIRSLCWQVVRTRVQQRQEAGRALQYVHTMQVINALGSPSMPVLILCVEVMMLAPDPGRGRNACTLQLTSVPTGCPGHVGLPWRSGHAVHPVCVPLCWPAHWT